MMRGERIEIKLSAALGLFSSSAGICSGADFVASVESEPACSLWRVIVSAAAPGMVLAASVQGVNDCLNRV
jgi:hypothetical protein